MRQYHADYNNNSPSTVSFMTVITSTSGRTHSEFIRLLFLQDHRETDRFFAASGVQVEQSTSSSGLSQGCRTAQPYVRNVKSNDKNDKRLILSEKVVVFVEKNV